MTYDDIREDIYDGTKQSSADSGIAAWLTRQVKRANNRVTSLILTADGRYEYDDSNRADLPIVVTAIVSGQADYSIDTSYIRIRRVELKGPDGVWRKLDPRDNEDYPNDSIAQRATTTGVPTEYDIIGNSVFLGPTPNYSQAASLRFYIERAQLDFDFSTNKFTDGTGSASSSPGFNSLYHELLSAWPNYNYCLLNIPELAAGHFATINRLEKALVADYSRRNRDDRPQITMRGTSFR
jgi:hypothetical protein